MDELIKNNEEFVELSINATKEIQGGSPLMELIFEDLGWLAGNFNYYYEAGAEGAKYAPKF